LPRFGILFRVVTNFIQALPFQKLEFWRVQQLKLKPRFQWLQWNWWIKTLKNTLRIFLIKVVSYFCHYQIIRKHPKLTAAAVGVAAEPDDRRRAARHVAHSEHVDLRAACGCQRLTLKAVFRRRFVHIFHACSNSNARLFVVQ